MADRRPATRAVHAGLPPARNGDPFLPGPVFAAPFHLAGEPSPSGYGRYDNPTWALLEAAMGELEGGHALVFPSGMAAITAVLFSLVPPDGVVVIPSDGYFTVRPLAHEQLGRRGVEVREVPTDDDALLGAVSGASLVLVETPSNPGLDVCDIRAVAAAAHEAGALVAVDNTLATPLGQRPLELGADLSVTSGTKMLCGHSDVLLGVVTAAREEQRERLLWWRSHAGGITGPMEAWLAHRSLATLGVRAERQSANALALAELLSARDDVASVRYPGLPGDPAHEVAARQMLAFGPVVCFDAGSEARAQAFLAAAELVGEATSFGSVHTTAERRGRWGSDDVPEGFIRLSAGCEDVDDLREDVAAALDATARS
jgi:cystathionine gamma-lyase